MGSKWVLDTGTLTLIDSSPTAMSLNSMSAMARQRCKGWKHERYGSCCRYNYLACFVLRLFPRHGNRDYNASMLWELLRDLSIKMSKLCMRRRIFLSWTCAKQCRSGHSARVWSATHAYLVLRVEGVLVRIHVLVEALKVPRLGHVSGPPTLLLSHTLGEGVWEVRQPSG